MALVTVLPSRREGLTMRAADPVIVVRGLAFRHADERPLLEDIGFELAPRERLGLLGGNGCGKSTLLQLLLGLLPRAGGEVVLCGQACQSERDFRAVRGRIGLMFQDVDDQLFCPTVQEDVAFGPLNQGLAHEAVRARVAAVLAQLQIAHLAERPVHHLSGGEKRLVALAGLLAMQPQALLLDEPTTGLDAQAQARVLNVLRGLPQALLVVSHDTGFMEALCTRTLHLEGGRLQARPLPLRPAQALP